ncbi:hypothetical protein QQF64_010308 [Cirrhinus molitorella]|uniref:Uncharacterized protein n=1 Tax=Cirrhinus molitorella TaxID=172907 RepID=A0ABR3M3N0_9TELE
MKGCVRLSSAKSVSSPSASTTGASAMHLQLINPLDSAARDSRPEEVISDRRDARRHKPPLVEGAEGGGQRLYGLLIRGRGGGKNVRHGEMSGPRRVTNHPLTPIYLGNMAELTTPSADLGSDYSDCM